MKNLKDPALDPKVRRQTVATLAGLGRPAVPALVVALDDWERGVRRAAVQALRQIAPEELAKAADAQD
jgi:HEAT repeat protein